MTILPGEPTKTGFAFDSWSYKGAEYRAEQMIQIESNNVILVAKWKANATPPTNEPKLKQTGSYVNETYVLGLMLLVASGYLLTMKRKKLR